MEVFTHFICFDTINGSYIEKPIPQKLSLGAASISYLSFVDSRYTCRSLFCENFACWHLAATSGGYFAQLSGLKFLIPGDTTDLISLYNTMSLKNLVLRLV